MMVPRAVNGTDVTLHWMVLVDALRGMSTGGAVDGHEFPEIALVSMLSLHLLGEGEGSGIVRSGEKVSLLSLLWFVVGTWWEDMMGRKAQSIRRVQQCVAKKWSCVGVVGVGWQHR